VAKKNLCNKFFNFITTWWWLNQRKAETCSGFRSKRGIKELSKKKNSVRRRPNSYTDMYYLIQSFLRNWCFLRLSTNFRIICNPTVHHSVYNNPPLVSIPSQINPVLAPHPMSWRILISSCHLRLGLPSGLFASGFPTRTVYARLPYTRRTAYHDHFTPLRLISQIIFGEQYRSWRSSWCIAVHSRVPHNM
jgi:hypothetical protein